MVGTREVPELGWFPASVTPEEAVMELLHVGALPETLDVAKLGAALAVTHIQAQAYAFRSVYAEQVASVTPTHRDLVLWFWIRASHPPRPAPSGQIAREISLFVAEMDSLLFQEPWRSYALAATYILPRPPLRRPGSDATMLSLVYGMTDPVDSLLGRIVAEGPIFLSPPIYPEVTSGENPPIIPPIKPSLDAGRAWVRASKIYPAALLFEQVSDERVPNIQDWLVSLRANQSNPEGIHALLVEKGIPDDQAAAFVTSYSGATTQAG